MLVKMIFLVDLVRYQYTIKGMTRYKRQLNQIFECIEELDAAISIASFRESTNVWCKPEFISDKKILFQDVYHPLLHQPVCNTAELIRDSIFSGSNASGKSTFIKAVAINAVLAQTIHTCCANKYQLQFAYVATSMALRDNVIKGESYFIAEIKSLKRIFSYCKKKHCICFIDEILRGTNTHERIAASTAVLRQLARIGSLCVAASHDMELTVHLQEEYDNYHFREQVTEDSILFDYILKQGPSSTTNAIKLLKIMGFDLEIIEEAGRMLNKTHE